MPSQYSVDIPFTANQHQQNFKLIELPPELLALLESDDKPTSVPRVRFPTSSLMSLPNISSLRFTVTSVSASPGTPGPALLNTGMRSYQMRQKNTSNPIMLLKPSLTGPTETDDPATIIPQPSVCTIAKIEDTIELILQDLETAEKAPPKVNKWHEKFAKGRTGTK